MMEVITRQEAIEQGLKWYFTGKPCKHGHIARRSLAGPCQECSSIAYHTKYSERHKQANAEKKKHRIEKQRLDTIDFCKQHNITFVVFEDAKAQGLPRYFDGVKCKRGHLSERFINTYHCVECGKLRAKKYLERHPDRRHETQIRYAAKPETKKNRKAYYEKLTSDPEFLKNHYKKYKAMETEEQAETRRKKSREYARLPHVLERQRLRNFNRWQNDPEYRLKRRIECQLRRRRIRQATPNGVDKFAIAKFYQKAISLTEKTGITYEVDHIVPLKHDKICGLNVPWNMQILTKSENSRKHNKWETN